MSETISCVYQIKNIIDSKRYIGSTINFEEREKGHLKLLKAGKHHSSHLQNAYNLYGKNNFIFEILERCPVNDLDTREQYWIDYYQAANDNYGYNICGYAYSTRGRKASKELRKRLSKIHRGENNANASLSKDDVIKIKQLLRDGAEVMRLSEMFDVVYQTIYAISLNDRWQEVDIDGLENKYTKEELKRASFKHYPGAGKAHNRKFSDDDILNMRKLYSDGLYTYKEIGNMYHADGSTVFNAINGITYSNVFDINKVTQISLF